jgi:hypothetical protein
VLPWLRRATGRGPWGCQECVAQAPDPPAHPGPSPRQPWGRSPRAWWLHRCVGVTRPAVSGPRPGRHGTTYRLVSRRRRGAAATVRGLYCGRAGARRMVVFAWGHPAASPLARLRKDDVTMLASLALRCDLWDAVQAFQAAVHTRAAALPLSRGRSRWGGLRTRQRHVARWAGAETAKQCCHTSAAQLWCTDRVSPLRSSWGAPDSSLPYAPHRPSRGRRAPPPCYSRSPLRPAPAPRSAPAPPALRRLQAAC